MYTPILFLRALQQHSPGEVTDAIHDFRKNVRDWDSFLLEVVNSEDFCPAKHGLSLFPTLQTFDQLDGFCGRIDPYRDQHREMIQELVDRYPGHPPLLCRLMHHSREVAGKLPQCM